MCRKVNLIFRIHSILYLLLHTVHIHRSQMKRNRLTDCPNDRVLRRRSTRRQPEHEPDALAQPELPNVEIPPEPPDRQDQPAMVAANPPMERVCASCGEPGHLRSSNRNCRNYRPAPRHNVPEQMLENRHQTRSNRIGLNKILLQIGDQHVRLRHAIRSVVHRMTVVSFEASRALYAFVLQQLGEPGRILMDDEYVEPLPRERNEDQPQDNAQLPNLSYGARGCMRQFFAGVISSSRGGIALNRRNQVRNQQINQFFGETYAPMRPRDLEWNDAKNLSHFISADAMMHSTNCENHVVKNLPTKLLTWSRYQVRKKAYNQLNRQLAPASIRALERYII